jgi:hypothetical protein
MSNAKTKQTYATVQRNGGMGFREIAEIMNQDGDAMNHNTARNHLHRGLCKLALPLARMQGFSGEEAEKAAYRIAQNPDFQDAIHRILSGDS